MATTIVLVLALAVLAVLAFASTRPDTFSVERSIRIDAPAASIYPHLEDFHAWAAWSPYEKLDAELQKTYSGAPSGEGAVYAWRGKKAGAGRMEIVETIPPRLMEIDLRFEKPFKSENTTVFALEEMAEATKVTWRMTGPMPFVTKLMCLVVNLDRMIGKDFEAGLASLKSVVERPVAA